MHPPFNSVCKEFMMGKIVSSAVILGIVGLIAGYFLFGKVGNSYIDLKTLILPSDDFFKQLGNTIRGVEEIRRKVLITGGAGAVVGVVIGVMRTR
jgi:hypothetical protein